MQPELLPIQTVTTRCGYRLSSAVQQGVGLEHFRVPLLAGYNTVPESCTSPTTQTSPLGVWLQAELERVTEEEELSSDEVLLRRMDAGLYTLQQCALVIGNLWMVGDQGVKQRLLMLLHQQVGPHAPLHTPCCPLC